MKAGYSKDEILMKEELYKSYINKANEARRQNNQEPSKAELVSLNDAYKILKTLVAYADGSARTLLLKKLDEIKERREEIAKYLDPQWFEEAVAKSRAAEESSKGTPAANHTAKNTEKKSADKVDENEVQAWFAEKPAHGFDDVAGMKHLIERLSNCALGVQWKLVKEYLGMPTVYTYFFYGLPGCGKTYIANAFAHELMKENYTYITLTGGKIMSSKVGYAEKTIERVFEEAKKNAPCILFIDEIDGVCADRDDDSTPQYAKSLTTAFLTGFNSLKEFEKKMAKDPENKDVDKKIIFIAATNYPNLVDRAMLDRAELIYVEIPDVEARCHSFKLKYSKLFKLEEGFTFMEMAERTEGYNYRDLDRLEEHLKDKIFTGIREAYTVEVEALEALKSGEYPLTREHFEEALAAYEPTPKDKEKEAMQKWREKIARAL